MTYKTILVHFNDEQRCKVLLRTALQVAAANDAHVIGLGVMPPIIVVPGTEGDVGAVIEDHRTQYRPQLLRMREAFETGLKERGVRGEWLEIDSENENPFGDVGHVALEHARPVDLVIAATANPAWSLSAYLDVAETLVMDSGRPVLLMPNRPVKEPIGRSVLVAWNASREAARAVFDALPLLTAAERVMVAHVEESAGEDGRRDNPGAALCKSLARHGVTCEALPPIPPGTSIGSALVQAAQRHDADLMVMGCYGHSRLRELFLGGASRHILQHLPLPVLMSH